jgi:hypothetical protein
MSKRQLPREVDYICMHTYSIDFDSDLVLFLYSHSNVLFDVIGGRKMNILKRINKTSKSKDKQRNDQKKK